MLGRAQEARRNAEGHSWRGKLKNGRRQKPAYCLLSQAVAALQSGLMPPFELAEVGKVSVRGPHSRTLFKAESETSSPRAFTVQG